MEVCKVGSAAWRKVWQQDEDVLWRDKAIWA